MTLNDLCTCIVLTKWDGPSRVQTSPKMLQIKKVNVIILSQPKPRWHYQWRNMGMTVTRCTFAVDFKELKTIPQSLTSMCTICLQPRQSGHHRRDIESPRLSGVSLNPWIFEYEFRDIFAQDVWHTRKALTKWRKKCPKLTQDGMLNMSSCYKLRLTFTAVRLQGNPTFSIHEKSL